MPHVCACGILAYQKKGQRMRVNTAYKEGLRRILETGDMSRVRQEGLDVIFDRKEVAFYILPMGRERADTIVKGKYSFKVSCFTGKAEIEHERAVQVTDAIKEFLSRAEETQEYDEVSGDAMLALIEWQKAYKECADAQRECSALVGANRDFQAARQIAQSSVADEDAQRHARAKMRIIKKRIIEENRGIFERCYKAQETLEKARKAIQAQVETEPLEYQESMRDE